MINALLDPNQIPLVRAIERRAGELAQRPFEPNPAQPTADAGNTPVIELEARDAQGHPRFITLGGPATPVAETASPSPWAMSTQTFLRTQPAAAPVSVAAPSVLASPSVQESPLLAVAEPAGAATSKSASDASAPWQQRWLQWLQAQGTDVQLRLRDYRLQESDYPRLIEQLHQFTREQGLTLTRLMVNGRELWRLPASETGVSHGR